MEIGHYLVEIFQKFAIHKTRVSHRQIVFSAINSISIEPGE